MFPLRVLDLTLPTPAENLACDEALLDAAEAGACGSADFTTGVSIPLTPPEVNPALRHGVLRFWEPAWPFVVLGYANKVAEEVNTDACRERGIPIFRRCSGGGAVLQGPGCLNYSVILRIDSDPALQTIFGANRFVLERNRDALTRLLSQPVSIEGHTDLAVNQLKFSGNAQRRKRGWLLFHGTFLLDFDIGQIEELLRPPRRQPPYRQQRRHSEFLMRLPLAASRVKAALRNAWKAASPLTEVPHRAIARLLAERYSRDEWNLKG